MKLMACLGAEDLAEYVDGALGPARRKAVEHHIDGCVACRTLLSDLARMHAADDGEYTDVDGEGTTTLGEASTVHEPSNGARYIGIIPGTMIGEYEVTGPIGAGGMGAVYAAVHPRIGKKVAIKVLKRGRGQHKAHVRFENEARAVNAIGHENIVDIFGFGEMQDGNPYFVMEHVEGESLWHVLERSGAISLAQTLTILRPIVDALAAAHERGIVHRDLKPGNIMVSGSLDGTARPRIKVLDFGLAKTVRTAVDPNQDLTNPGVALGTPHFMSPEQAMGGMVDHRTDIYALGVLVYQMLTGRYPYEGDSPTEIGQQHLSASFVAPSSLAPAIPAAVDRVLARALAKNPDHRCASVRDLLAELEACAVLPTAMNAVRTRQRRTWLLATAAVATATAALVVVTLGGGNAAAPVSTPAPTPVETASPEPPATAPSPAPAPAPLPVPASVPAPAPPEPTAAATGATADPPVAAKPPAKKSTRTRARKSPATASSSPVVDDRMLLQSGTLKKKPTK